MTVSATATMTGFAPIRPAPPVDNTPIILTAQLLGLVTGTAMIVGLIPAAIVLLRLLF